MTLYDTMIIIAKLKNEPINIFDHGIIFNISLNHNEFCIIFRHIRYQNSSLTISKPCIDISGPILINALEKQIRERDESKP